MDDDRIEHHVSIRASADRVWDLVSRPGWWLPGAESAPARGVGRVAVPQGSDSVSYVIDVVRFEPRGYVAFRWANAFGGIMPADGRATLVEFSVTPAGAGCEVTVTESGFDTLDLPEALRASERAGSEGTWRYEMAGLRTRAEQGEGPGGEWTRVRNGNPEAG